MISRPRVRAQGANGFTLIELMVVISVIALLMALLLPAVASARAASRKAQCQNNLRNLGIAMLARADSARRFPASGNVGNNATTALPFHNWVVELLPWIDRHDLFDLWKFDLPQNGAANRSLAGLHLAVLTCPADITAIGAGDLSYVVNGGFGWTSTLAGVSDCPLAFSSQALDLNGNGVACPRDATKDGKPSDKDFYFQTALFFLENWKVPNGTLRHHTPDDVVDGLSHTIMIAENVKAGYDPFSPDTNWASPDPRRNSFFVSFGVCHGGRCSAGNVDYRRANRGVEAINGALQQAEGEAPWPSSYHAGGVYAVFADGHVKFLAQEIGGAVYAALVSPQGSRIAGPLLQRPPSDVEY